MGRSVLCRRVAFAQPDSGGGSWGITLRSIRAPAPVESSEESSPQQAWMEPIPIPADPELEGQIREIQGALMAVQQQIVRRKDALEKTDEPAQKAQWYEELETLRRERRILESLLNDLIDEAKASERTAIDEALAHARWLEQQQERWYQKEELLRDRQ